MKIEKGKTYVSFRDPDGGSLRIGYSNRGDPYMEGAEFEVQPGDESSIWVFLENHELDELRDLLIRLRPLKAV